MILDELKKRVHHLTNKLQALLSYIELEKYDRARAVAREASVDLVALGQLLYGLDIVSLPSSGTIEPPVVVLPVSVALTEAALTESEENFLRELDRERPDASVVIPFQQLYINHGHEKENDKPDGADVPKKPPSAARKTE